MVKVRGESLVCIKEGKQPCPVKAQSQGWGGMGRTMPVRLILKRGLEAWTVSVGWVSLARYHPGKCTAPSAHLAFQLSEDSGQPLCIPWGRSFGEQCDSSAPLQTTSELQRQWQNLCNSERGISMTGMYLQNMCPGHTFIRSRLLFYQPLFFLSIS